MIITFLFFQQSLGINAFEYSAHFLKYKNVSNQLPSNIQGRKAGQRWNPCVTSFKSSSITLTQLRVLTQEPPTPPGYGKSALDVIGLPLLTFAMIPLSLMFIDSKTVEIALISSDSYVEQAENIIQVADTRLSSIQFMESPSISTTIIGWNDSYDAEFDSNSLANYDTSINNSYEEPIIRYADSRDGAI